MRSPRAPEHTCHIPTCPTLVPPRMLMCWPHWKRVPSLLRRMVYATYRDGQERDKSPSQEYLRAVLAAITHIVHLEGDQPEALASVERLGRVLAAGGE